jgi:putative SOS response-associated peptidase YedK
VLIPHWLSRQARLHLVVTQGDEGRDVQCARAETVSDKPIFREAFKRRCPPASTLSRTENDEGIAWRAARLKAADLNAWWIRKMVTEKRQIYTFPLEAAASNTWHPISL